MSNCRGKWVCWEEYPSLSEQWLAQEFSLVHRVSSKNLMPQLGVQQFFSAFHCFRRLFERGSVVSETTKFAIVLQFLLRMAHPRIVWASKLANPLISAPWYIFRNSLEMQKIVVPFFVHIMALCAVWYSESLNFLDPQLMRCKHSVGANTSKLRTLEWWSWWI